MSFRFSIMSPERDVFDGDVDQVRLRSDGGDIGFLTGHVPFIGEVRPSICEIDLPGGDTQALALLGGFVEVGPDGAVNVLADAVERREEIDVAAAQQARQDAARRLQDGHDPDVERLLQVAEVRLEVAGVSIES